MTARSKPTDAAPASNSPHAQVAHLIKTVVQPAADEFSAEMQATGRDCKVFRTGNVVTIEVRYNQRREFIYGLKIETKEPAPLEALTGSVLNLLRGGKPNHSAFKAGGNEKQYHPMTVLSLKQAQSWNQQSFTQLLHKKYRETAPK